MANKDNLVADCLSRAQVGSVHLGVDYFAIPADQLVNLKIQAFRSAVTGLRLQDVSFLDKGARLLCDVSTGQPWSPLAGVAVFLMPFMLFRTQA